jgi:two-component system chemotaxis response regulator CheB
MMSAIRVLFIDDSVVVRRMLCDALTAEPGLEVVATAPNGRIGLSKIAQTTPEVVVLDLDMPEMNGLETLEVIRFKWPTLPVIIYSSLTHRGAVATLEALERGANDYVAKPARTGSREESEAQIRDDLIPKILALGGRRPSAELLVRRPAESLAPSWPTPPMGSLSRAIEIVAIGASTGGPNALATLIPSLPADFPVPIVIVQHMPPLFTAMLAERLDSKSSIRVTEATHGDRLEPGRVWIAPGDHHMIVIRDGGSYRIEISHGPRENSCRPSVDVLFRSVSEIYGPRVLGVMLTGMGNDGLKGSMVIRQAGGGILAQDEATSVVWGMPGFVARAGLAERVLPLEEIGAAIVGRASAKQPVGKAV